MHAKVLEIPLAHPEEVFSPTFMAQFGTNADICQSLMIMTCAKLRQNGSVLFVSLYLPCMILGRQCSFDRLVPYRQ